MGEIIRFTHKNCKFCFDFREGVGFGLFRAQCNARENMRTGKWGAHWKGLIERHPNGTAKLGNVMLFCPKCAKYYVAPQITFLIPQEGKVYTFDDENPDTVPAYLIDQFYEPFEEETMVCPDCGESVTIISNYNEVPCPVCGKLRKGRTIGRWD